MVRSMITPPPKQWPRRSLTRSKWQLRVRASQIIKLSYKQLLVKCKDKVSVLPPNVYGMIKTITTPVSHTPTTLFSAQVSYSVFTTNERLGRHNFKFLNWDRPHSYSNKTVDRMAQFKSRP